MRPSCCLLLFAYHFVTGPAGLSLPATYDQRQTGDLNVQIHVKDVQVLALLDSGSLDDYTEYDYFYDYADFTLKPIVKPTTSTTESSPSVSETTDKVVVSVSPDSSSEHSTPLSTTDRSSSTNLTIGNVTIPVPTDAEKVNETTAILSTVNINDTSNTMVNNKTESQLDDVEENSADKIEEGSSMMEPPSTRLSQKRCRTGYSRNGNGRCRRLSKRRLSLIPLAIKLAPKLLDDLSRTTKNLAQEEVHRMRSN